ILIRQTEFFRSEKKSTRAGCEVRSNVTSAVFQPNQGVLQIPMSNGGGSHNQRAVGNRLSHCLVNFGGRQRSRGTHGGTSVPECYIVGIHYPQIGKSKVAHGPGGRTNVERIAHVH